MKSTGRKQQKWEREVEAGTEEQSLQVSPERHLSRVGGAWGSTSKAKSPLQCAEMVFGSNLMTNLDTLLLSSNKDQDSQLNNSTLSAAALLHHKQLEQKQ